MKVGLNHLFPNIWDLVFAKYLGTEVVLSGGTEINLDLVHGLYAGFQMQIKVGETCKN